MCHYASTAMSGLAAGFVPFIIGFIISSVGFTVMYQLMACVACIALVMYYFVHGKKVS